RKTKFVAAGAVLIFAALVVALLYQPAPPAIVLPNPNGYDDFVKAATIVVGTSDWHTQDIAQLRLTVPQNANALALIRSGLKKECRSAGYDPNALSRLAEFKGLAYAFVAEAKLAEKEGRTNDAIRSYLDCIRFGEEFCRGGVLIE